MNKVSPERTGWRDEGISTRHRLWGFDCPALDLDFVMVEYDYGKPMAIVEYKNERAQYHRKDSNGYKAVALLASNSKIPFIGCIYTSDLCWYAATALNEQATIFIPRPLRMTEFEWVELLYEIRGRDMPSDLFDVQK